jgi:hypothetical protein
MSTQTQTQSPIGDVITNTLYTDSDIPTEVLVVSIVTTNIGTQLVASNPNIFTTNLSSWMRKGYQITGEKTKIQIPRNGSDMPLDADSGQVTNVYTTDNSLEFYYPVSKTSAMVVEWIYPTDTWSAEFQSISFTEGAVELEDPNRTQLWSLIH